MTEKKDIIDSKWQDFIDQGDVDMEESDDEVFVDGSGDELEESSDDWEEDWETSDEDESASISSTPPPGKPQPTQDLE